jgi:diguanylate cyclase (GGDEF)-like protein
VGHALKSVARDYDPVGRWGGDEFLALLTDVHGVDEHALKRRIRQRLTSEGVPLGLPDLSASIGIARYPGDGDTAEALIEVAQERPAADMFRGEDIKLRPFVHVWIYSRTPATR